MILPRHHALTMAQDASSVNPEESRRPRRWSVLNHFVDRSLRHLAPTCGLVWLVMFRHARSDGMVRISQGLIAQSTGLNVRTIRRILLELESAGHVSRIKHGGKGKGCSTYALIQSATPPPP